MAGAYRAFLLCLANVAQGVILELSAQALKEKTVERLRTKHGFSLLNTSKEASANEINGLRHEAGGKHLAVGSTTSAVTPTRPT